MIVLSSPAMPWQLACWLLSLPTASAKTSDREEGGGERDGWVEEEECRGVRGSGNGEPTI